MVIATKPQVSPSLLTVVENLSLLGSIAGTIILIASRQIAYAPAPLSFSVLLSLVNRQRIEQLVQQSNAPRITQVDPGLSREVKFLHDQVQALPSQIEALRTTTELLIQKSQDSIVPTLKQHLDQLPGYWEQSNLQAEVQETVAPVVERMKTLESIAAQLQSQVEFQLNQPAHNLSSPQQSEELSTAVNPVSLRSQGLGFLASEIGKLKQRQMLLEKGQFAPNPLGQAAKDEQESLDEANQATHHLKTANI